MKYNISPDPYHRTTLRNGKTSGKISTSAGSESHLLQSKHFLKIRTFPFSSDVDFRKCLKWPHTHTQVD